MHGPILNTSSLEPPLVTTARPSACPGLFRIVQALDGGICRIKLSGGSISSTQALVVADVAQQYAGGIIEATNRSNLQIRGIGEAHATLVETLITAGLGSSTVGGDDVRNVMLSPSAGIDRQMLCDTRPLAEQILATLQNDERFHDLSAKFAVQLDGGEGLAVLEHPHDLWLSAMEREGELVFAFGLAGCPVDFPAGSVRLEDGHALVMAVLELFLEWAGPDQTRMRHLLAECSLEKILARLGNVVPLMSVSDWQRGVGAGVLHIGAHPQHEAGRVYVGAVPPLGRLDPTMLRGVAQLARERGDGSLRFTPWQSLLLPGVPVDDAHEVIHRLEQLGLHCSADHALAHLIACTGSTGCGKGLADTKGDARQLAALMQCDGRAPNVHLSGCSRSCAAAHVAPVTLLAVSPGCYDLYFRDAGTTGFGVLHARNLTIEAAATLLDARSRSPLDA